MMAMTTISHAFAAAPEDPTATGHQVVFSDPEAVKAVVVPDLDPAKAAAVFSSPY
jgi:hypothetical protein